VGSPQRVPGVGRGRTTGGTMTTDVPYTCGRCGKEFWNPHRPYALNALMRHQEKCDPAKK